MLYTRVAASLLLLYDLSSVMIAMPTISYDLVTIAKTNEASFA